MNKPLYNPENIEAYITNKMSAADKSAFQNELSKDPLLNNEIDLQKDIINALKESRKAQLKKRLNNIQIDATTSYTGLKVAASILLAGLISFGTYNYISDSKMNNQNTTSSNSTLVTEKVISSTNTSATDHDENTISSTSSNSNNDVVSEKQKPTNSMANNNGISGKTIAKNEIQNKVSTSATTPSTKIVRNKTVETADPVVNAPEFKDRHDEDLIKTDNNIIMPKGDIGSTNGKSKPEVELIKDKNYNLFYQYYNNKLFLYGDFNSKLYDILELNTIKGKQVYLYFEEKYYGLNSNQIEITALTAIKDKETISELELKRTK